MLNDKRGKYFFSDFRSSLAILTAKFQGKSKNTVGILVYSFRILPRNLLIIYG